MQVLNVHRAVACAECAWSSCMCMSSEWESIAQLKDTDHTRRYDTKNTLMHFTALKQSGR